VQQPLLVTLFLNVRLCRTMRMNSQLSSFLRRMIIIYMSQNASSLSKTIHLATILQLAYRRLLDTRGVSYLTNHRNESSRRHHLSLARMFQKLNAMRLRQSLRRRRKVPPKKKKPLLLPLPKPRPRHRLRKRGLAGKKQSLLRRS